MLPAWAYREFEPRIRKLVRALHNMGIWTEDSCEGHLDPNRSSHPYVILCPTAFPNFFKFLGEWNWNRRGREWIIQPRGPLGEGWPNSFLYLQPWERNPQRDPAILRKLQQEAEELAEFLQQVESSPYRTLKPLVKY